MCARGATPLTSSTAGWQPPSASPHWPRTPAGTSVPARPAMMPPTNVPWNELSRSSGEEFAPRLAKPRETITFVVVPVPFGNPAGYEKPVGSKKGCSTSMPSSTTATLIPSPRAPVTPANCDAPMTEAPRLSSDVYV